MGLRLILRRTSWLSLPSKLQKDQLEDNWMIRGDLMVFGTHPVKRIVNINGPIGVDQTER